MQVDVSESNIFVRNLSICNLRKMCVVICVEIIATFANNDNELKYFSYFEWHFSAIKKCE